MGRDEEQAALVDCIAEHISEIKSKFRKIRDMPAGEAKVEALAKWYSSELPSWLAKLEDSLPSATPGYCVGEELSYADILLWHMFNEFFKSADVEPIYRAHLKLAIINDKVASLENLQKWLKARPVTPF